jgi:hypothetical protein
MKGFYMSAFEELEEEFSEIVKLMPEGPDFDSHDFTLKLAQRYQQFYVRALNEYASNDQPFQSVHKEIAKRLKKRTDLVVQNGTRYSEDIFGRKNIVAVWRKVKK